MKTVHKIVEDIDQSDKAGNTAMFYARRVGNSEIIRLLGSFGATNTIRHASFDRRLEKSVAKNVYNVKRISSEFAANSHRRSGSFHDIIFDYQKRGVFSDELNIIKVMATRCLK